MKADEIELKKLCGSAGMFWPDAEEQFICPGCLGVFSADSPEISIEHIIPKAANGKLEAFLCKKTCNNRFGEKTAKWLGSYLIHSVDALEKKRRSDRTSNHRFVLNGATLNGKVWQEDDGINILVLRDPPGSTKKKKINDPKELKKLDESDDSVLNLSFEDPLKAFKENEKYIKIGMLGAAYFLWFKAFGYSWVLQEHLSLIRKMLAEPDKYSPPDGWFYDIEDETVAIGFAVHNGAAFPAANIMGKIVALPSRSEGMPPDTPSQYEMIWLEGGALSTRYSQGAQAPHILMVNGQPVYIPDMLNRSIMEQFYAINLDTSTGEASYLENDGAKI